MSIRIKESHSVHPLIRIRKGLSVLFELTNVRIIEINPAGKFKKKKKKSNFKSGGVYMALHIECRFNKNSLLQRYSLVILPAGKTLLNLTQGTWEFV